MDTISKSRTTKRREKMHNEILAVASKLICEKGASAVSLEEISKHADVARKTVYNHFENKEALINELIMPVCEHAKNYLGQMEAKESISLEDIWNYCLELWKQKDLNALLLYEVKVDDYSNINESKHGFIIVFMKLFKRIPEFLKCNDKELKLFAEIVYSMYIPLLISLSNHKDYEALFKKGMTGLIKAIEQY